MPFLNEFPTADCLELASPGKTVPIVLSETEPPGVLRAARALSKDFGRVTGTEAALSFGSILQVDRPQILIGTLGTGPLVDQLTADGLLDVDDLAGVNEAYQLRLIGSTLVIIGSDRRGTIFGIYELSRELGVSPWHWWADAEPLPREAVFVSRNSSIRGAPAVRYRGIFLNDEYPALTRWVAATYGETDGVAHYDRRFYERIFELLLRLKANYLWPAMWNNAFHEDDPENARLADEMGIIMGTSHQEPMGRAQKEWDRRYRDSLGHWNYRLHSQVLEEFWREGFQRNAPYENVFTIGLRGADDTEMAGSPEANRAMLETIIAYQRQVLGQVPQVWCLYKEVMDYYRDGMEIPEDVTLLWSDDNWGNLRRLPTPEERKRPGGAGIYYHFDYHGGPRSYQWTDTVPLAKIWDQLSLARQYGADRIWIVNVGHLKGYELPTSFFLDLAWDPERYRPEDLESYTRDFASSILGSNAGAEGATLLDSMVQRYAGTKPELLTPQSYSLRNFHESERVLEDWREWVRQAEALRNRVPGPNRTAFDGIILFWAQAGALLQELYHYAGLNELFCSQGRASTNAVRERVDELFIRFQELVERQNKVHAGGRWNHFLDQAVLGYTGWCDPPTNSLDHLTLHRLVPLPGSVLGVAPEGMEPTSLPVFDRYHCQSRTVDVFNKGNTPFHFVIETPMDWLAIKPLSGLVDEDRQVRVTVDWSKVPAGTKEGFFIVRGAGSEIKVRVSLLASNLPIPDSFHGAIETEGWVAVDAGHSDKLVAQGPRRWRNISGFGISSASLRAEAETDPPRLEPGSTAPLAEYSLWFHHAGEAKIQLILSPALNFRAGKALAIGVSLDRGKPQTLVVVPGDYQVSNTNPDWNQVVSDGVRTVVAPITISQPGPHSIQVWMLDPGVVFHRLLVDFGAMPKCLLGPPESVIL